MITSAPFMPTREIKNLTETVIDSLRFVGDGDSFFGRLPLSSLPRLADVLVKQEGSLECRLSGLQQTDVTGQVQRFLKLQVSGDLVLQCQRCLAPVPFECVIDSRLLLVPEGAPWPEDELTADDHDALLASRTLSVRELVEDEVLLALPLAPRHENQDCHSQGDMTGSRGPSPFSVLAQLKKH